jgi:hypothetical protein
VDENKREVRGKKNNADACNIGEQRLRPGNGVQGNELMKKGA